MWYFGVFLIAFLGFTKAEIGVAWGVLVSEFFILSLIAGFLLVKYKRNEI